MNNTLLNDGKTLIVAEIGQAHDGSLGILHSYIDAVATAGIKAIKFQTHIAEAESSQHEPFRVKFSYEDDTRYAYWQRMEFTPEQWQGIKDHCDQAGLLFISSPFSNAAVDLLEDINCPVYKIGSGETSNLLLLERIARTGKPIILSTGMSSFEEIDRTLSFLSQYDNEIAILQCTTAYPTQPEQWGLNVIPQLQQRYTHPIGFSDHSGEIYACLAAAALGAQILEFHVTFDKQIFGPDSPASLNFTQAKSLVKGIDHISRAHACIIDKSDNTEFSGLKQIFEKSLAVNKNLSAGSILSINDLESKKPSNMGIDAAKFESVIGKKLNKAMQKWAFLQQEDINDE